MKYLKEYKISIVLSSLSLVSFAASAIMGLVGGANYTMDKTFMFLGFGLLLLGFAFLRKSKKIGENEE